MHSSSCIKLCTKLHGFNSSKNLSHTYGQHMSSSIIQNQLNSAQINEIFFWKFLVQRYGLMYTRGVAHVVVIIHVGHHMTLKHMMPHHHQFMCKCILCFCHQEKEEVCHCSDKRLDFHSFLKFYSANRQGQGL